MSDHLYVLDDNNKPVAEPDCVKWAGWFEKTELRIIKQDTVQEAPRVWVSTVFLGLDHNYRGRGAPVLWETMIFGGKLDQYQERYSSRSAAVKGHRRAVKLAKKAL